MKGQPEVTIARTCTFLITANCELEYFRALKVFSTFEPYSVLLASECSLVFLIFLFSFSRKRMKLETCTFRTRVLSVRTDQSVIPVSSAIINIQGRGSGVFY